MDYNSATSQLSTTLTVNFTSIKNLFIKSWQRVEKNLYRLFLLHIMVFFAVSILVIISGAILFWAGFFSPQTGPSPYSNTSVIIYTIVGIISLILITVALVSLNITTALLLSGTNSSLSLSELYKNSLTKVIPVLILLLIGSFLVIGGLIIFVLPGILFSLLLSMAFYFVVLDNQNPFGAFNKSVYIVSKNFGVVFGFAAGLITVNLIITFLLNNVFFDQNLTSLPAIIISFIFNLIYGWISMAYFMFIFQEIKNDSQGSSKTGWMFLLALIGWILIGVLGYFILTTPAQTTTLPTIQTNELPGFLNAPSGSLEEINITDTLVPTRSTTQATSSGTNR